MTIAFVDLKRQYQRLKPQILANIEAVLDHGQYIMGPEVGSLERALSDYTGAVYTIAVASGTDALAMALMAEDVGPGDAVFLPSFTFTATAEVIVLLGATPVFIDIDCSTLNLDPEDLQRRMEYVAATTELRPKAVIAVDLFGFPANYPAIKSVVDGYNAVVVGDAAQSLGGTSDNKRVGTLAEVTATSFFPAKPLGAYGDGGALFTDDGNRAELYRSIRAHGKGAGKYDIERVGLNSRLDTLQAAVLMAKIDIFDDEMSARRSVSEKYNERLEEYTGSFVDRSESAWAQYPILVDHRDEVMADLKAKGIPTAVYYPRPMHRQPAYEQFATLGDPPRVSEEISERVLCLPIHPYLKEEEIERVASAVCNSAEGVR